jgi:hypothetical protein
MPEAKPPYKLVVKFDGARPERIAEALAELRETAAQYDQTGESTATMTIESWQEAPLRAVMDDFEMWLYRHAPGLVKDQAMVLYRPGLRPETAELLAREKKKTPMDAVEGFDDDAPLITPPPRQVLQIAGPVEEAEIVLDDPTEVENI